jgi:hypothetical protein
MSWTASLHSATDPDDLFDPHLAAVIHLKGGAWIEPAIVDSKSNGLEKRPVRGIERAVD